MSEAAIFLAQTRYVVNRNIQIVVTQQGTATGHFSTCSYLTGYSVRLLLRKRVLHHCTHLGAKTCGRIQFDRCCLVTRLHKVKKFAPNFDVYVQRLDWPTGLQHPHRGRDCRRRARLPKVVICERKNNGSELDAPGKLRRWEGYHSPQGPRRAATGGFVVDEHGICT